MKTTYILTYLSPFDVLVTQTYEDLEPLKLFLKDYAIESLEEIDFKIDNWDYRYLLMIRPYYSILKAEIDEQGNLKLTDISIDNEVLGIKVSFKDSRIEFLNE